MAAIGFFAFATLAFFSPGITPFFITVVLLYIVANILHALYIYITRERSMRGAAIIFLATPLIHFSYGLGILYGIYKHSISASVQEWHSP